MRLSLLAAFTAASLTACGAGPGPGEFKADFKTNAQFFTNMKAAAKGTSPHGTQQTWYSTNVQGLLSGTSFTVPEGTVAIKEFDMMSDGTMDGYAVMVKKPAGYDAANNDWYYEMRMLDGTVMSDPPAGKTMMCIECHVASKATDFLSGTKLK
ncbi:MAG: hypothetical protein U0228_37805 [Myxococcaceae bacterium]